MKNIGNGIKIIGNEHTERLALGKITKFNISKDVLEITENINNEIYRVLKNNLVLYGLISPIICEKLTKKFNDIAEKEVVY